MRNFLILMLVVAGLSSCKKDWACECTNTDTKETHVAKYFAQTTKSEAKSLCNLYNNEDTRCEIERKK